jgi:RNA 3'-terminal phosphate cyclase (ATP)
MYELVEIDGRDGEGGGQIVRTAAALSAVSGRPARLIRIRAGRPRPGLQAQHLTALKAVATLCRADTEGLRLGSPRARITPGALAGGRYVFAVPTAGSALLVAQAILPALLEAPEPTEVVIEGGTHVSRSPSFDHTEGALLPALRAMGAQVDMRLERRGFFPKGGGRVVLEAHPWRERRPLARTAPVRAWTRAARLHVSGLPEHVEKRARGRLEKRGYRRIPTPEGCTPAAGPGFAATLHLSGAEGEEDVVTGLGARGTPAEVVVDRAAGAVEAFAATGAPVGEHLADQLLVFLALGGGGRFRTVAPTPHFETQARTIRRFLDVEVRWAADADGTYLVEVA